MRWDPPNESIEITPSHEREILERIFEWLKRNRITYVVEREVEVDDGNVRTAEKIWIDFIGKTIGPNILEDKTLGSRTPGKLLGIVPEDGAEGQKT
jgi:hypothetical protein